MMAQYMIEVQHKTAPATLREVSEILTSVQDLLARWISPQELSLFDQFAQLERAPEPSPITPLSSSRKREPQITYRSEVQWAKMPPTLIEPPDGRWKGCLYVGSTSAALSQEWLSWAGITHSINTVGKYTKDQEYTG